MRRSVRVPESGVVVLQFENSGSQARFVASVIGDGVNTNGWDRNVVEMKVGPGRVEVETANVRYVAELAESYGAEHALQSRSNPRYYWSEAEAHKGWPW